MKDYMPGWYAMVLAYKRGIIDGPRRARVAAGTSFQGLSMEVDFCYLKQIGSLSR